MNNLNHAIEYATRKHTNQVRKSTNIPYIVHPMETCSILAHMHANEDLLCAGILHDVLEDTNTTTIELSKNFNENICHLVISHTEDKSKTWKERKQHTIDSLKDATLEYKMLIFADKLANLRSIYYDYFELENDLFKRFNASKKELSWYYWSIYQELNEFEKNKRIRLLYREMYHILMFVFGQKEEN